MVCYKYRLPFTEVNPQHYGVHFACFRDWFKVENVEKFSDVISKTSQSTGDPHKKGEFTKFNASFFHGKFKKYSAVLGRQSYILKVAEDDFPELPATEFLSNKIAEELKMDVAPFYLINFEEIPTFVTKNFMQNYNAANLIHIYHFCNALSEFNCEHLLKVIEDKTGRLTDIERFIELCLFDALIANSDRHGRNIGLIQTVKGYQLSPFYDNPSNLGIEDERLLDAHLEPRGTIAVAHTKEPKAADYVKEFRRLGYSDTVNKFIKKIHIERIEGLVAESFISSKRRSAMTRLIIRRHQELVDESK